MHDSLSNSSQRQITDRHTHRPREKINMHHNLFSTELFAQQRENVCNSCLQESPSHSNVMSLTRVPVGLAHRNGHNQPAKPTLLENKHAKITCTFKSGNSIIRKQRHIISHMHVSFIIPPSLRTIFSVLVQASPWSTFVKYTHPDKSWEDSSWTLDFVLSGRCWCCNGPLGEGREGSPHTVRVHECIFALCWNLKSIGSWQY